MKQPPPNPYPNGPPNDGRAGAPRPPSSVEGAALLAGVMMGMAQPDPSAGKASQTADNVERRTRGEKRTAASHHTTFPQESVRWAPVTSHISRFAIDSSDVYIGFKGPEGSGEVAQYVYHFGSEEAALDIYERLAASPHPYGQVLYPLVIEAGVDYTPL